MTDNFLTLLKIHQFSGHSPDFLAKFLKFLTILTLLTFLPKWQLWEKIASAYISILALQCMKSFLLVGQVVKQ